MSGKIVWATCKPNRVATSVPLGKDEIRLLNGTLIDRLSGGAIARKSPGIVRARSHAT
jgi:hypothetical protein